MNTVEMAHGSGGQAMQQLIDRLFMEAFNNPWLAEQGKGFAVVAGEVRHLASRSASAANDIRKLIDASASKVQSGSEQVHAAGRTMDDIVEQVKNVTQLIAQISHSTSEQATGLSELTRAVAELDSITQKNADLVEESAHISAMVKHRAGRLKDAVTVLH